MPIDPPRIGKSAGKPGKPALKGKPGAGGAKLFGYPWYVIAGGVVVAIVVGLYLRKHFQGASGSATGPASTADTAGNADGSGGSGITSDTGATNGADTSGGLAGTLAALQLLGYGSVGGAGATTTTTTTGGTSEEAASATAPVGQAAALQGAAAGAQIGSSFLAGIADTQDRGGLWGDISSAAAAAPAISPAVSSGIGGFFGSDNPAPATVHPVTSQVIDHPAVAGTISGGAIGAGAKAGAAAGKKPPIGGLGHVT